MRHAVAVAGLGTGLLLVCSTCGSGARPSQSAERSPASAAEGSGITREEAPHILPVGPSNLTVADDAGTIRLTWSPTGEDVAYYRCLRRRSGDETWTEIARTSGDGSQPSSLFCVDYPAPGSGAYVYGVQAVNRFGAQSAVTVGRAVTVR